MIRRQVVTLEIEYDDLDGKRHPPAEWDWTDLADMAGDESVEVLASGWVLAPREAQALTPAGKLTDSLAVYPTERGDEDDTLAEDMPPGRGLD